MEAFRSGLDHGYLGIETDAMLTRDGVPVLIHDEELARTVQNDPRRVPDLTAAEIAQVEAGGWMAPRWYGAAIPRLSTAIEWCRRNGMWMNLEIKPAAGHETETGRVVAAMAAEAWRDKVRPGGDRQENVVPEVPLLSSFERASLAAAREVAPDLPRGLLIDEVPADWREACRELGCAALHVNWETVTPQFARDVKAEGLWLFAYTPNEIGVIRRLFAMGVDGLCTDMVDRVPPVL